MGGFDFPDSPSIGDTVFAKYKTFKKFANGWDVVPTETPTIGVIDGGNVDAAKIVISAGASTSVFSSSGFDCGGA